MPLSVSQAWREAAATVDAQEVMLPTLELRHSAFQEGGTPVALRFVRNTEDLVLVLEPGAPMDAGSAVTFTRAGFQVGYPRIGKFGAEVSLTLDNVKREVQHYAKAATAFNEPIRASFRGYLASDPGTVGLGPYSLVLRGVRCKGSVLEATLTSAMPRQTRVLADVFDAVRFPALTRWT
jgi:hypothetical protein